MRKSLILILAAAAISFATDCGTDQFLTCNPSNVAQLPPAGALKAADAFSLRVGNGEYRSVTLAALSSDTTFVDSVRGYSTVPTITVKCSRLGSIRTCTVPAFTGTSNVTTLTLDAWPSGWRVLASQSVGGLVMTDNTSTTRQTAKVVAATTGVLTFTFADSAGVSAAFTNTGTKALGQAFQITFIAP